MSSTSSFRALNLRPWERMVLIIFLFEISSSLHYLVDVFSTRCTPHVARSHQSDLECCISLHLRLWNFRRIKVGRVILIEDFSLRHFPGLSIKGFGLSMCGLCSCVFSTFGAKVCNNWDVLLQLNRNSGAVEFGVVQCSRGGTEASYKQRRHLIDSSKKENIFV